jgi:glycosyltransferase involved in cell wall biosynthesis
MNNSFTLPGHIPQPFKTEDIKPRVLVVLPAYNAARTLERTLADIPVGSVEEILLVDDCSNDETVAIAKRSGLSVIEHTRNQGYGGNQKTCYRYALQSKAEIVVMLHPDYQTWNL